MANSGISTRRLALNACDGCRRRKTKCDEKKPHCSRCARLGLDCSYVATVASKKNLSVTELADTLQRMDDKLTILTVLAQKSDAGRQSSLPSQQNPPPPAQPVWSDSSGALAPPFQSSPHTSLTCLSPGNASSFSAFTPFLDTGRIRDELSLSNKHSVAPQHLLTWPCSPVNLSEQELQYPLDLEVKRRRMSRSVAPPLCLALPGAVPEAAVDHAGGSWLSRLSFAHMNILTRFYFEHFHPSCLILDEAAFYSQDLSSVTRTNFAENFSTCITLLVCALGSGAAYHSGHSEWAPAGLGDDDVGIGFFNLAMHMFREIEDTSWVSVQCLLLMGTFYSAKMRVYDAWSAIHKACCTILILVPLQHKLEAQHCQLFWIAYLQESQLLAEFDFPASGLGKLAGTIELPVVPEAGTDARHAQYQFFFLALISMRKLLNRILYHLYCSDQSEESANCASSPNDKLLPFQSASRAVVYELDRQIEEWRECLPPGLQFSSFHHDREQQISTQPRTTDQRLRGHLIARYYAAKSIVHRPFVYRSFHCDDLSLLSERDKAGTQTALECAFRSVLHGGLSNEPLALLLHPINSCRCMFALEIQLALVRRSDLQFPIPDEWRVIPEIRSRVRQAAQGLSPTVTRDFELLDLLV